MYVIDWTAVAIVSATILGPILAVWASEIRQHRKQARDRREWVFRSLMTTRSSRLSPDHVSALNHIDFAFPQKSYPEVADAWGLYYAHLHSPQGNIQESMNRWTEAGYNLLVELLHQMATVLDIPFSKTSIQKSAYYPQGYVFTEHQQNELRALVLEVLRGDRPISIRPVLDTPPEQHKIS
jgi:hypothetical protein